MAAAAACVRRDPRGTLSEIVLRDRRTHLVLALVALLARPAGSAAPGAAPNPVVARPTDEVRIVSLNLAMREDAGAIAAELVREGLADADVLLLQEVAGRAGRPSVAHRLAEVLGRPGPDLKVRHSVGFALGADRTVGLATLSRFPVVDSRVLPLTRFDLNFRTRDRIALAVVLDSPAGRLSTYNLHLDTRINTGQRLRQLADVVRDIQPSVDRVIVAGDFNTNRAFWLFHMVPLPFIGRQGRGVERFMTSHGLASVFEGGATHDALGMRLDWVFLKGLRARSSSIHPVELSDHHALSAEILPGRIITIS